MLPWVLKLRKTENNENKKKPLSVVLLAAMSKFVPILNAGSISETTSWLSFTVFSFKPALLLKLPKYSRTCSYRRTRTVKVRTDAALKVIKFVFHTLTRRMSVNMEVSVIS